MGIKIDHVHEGKVCYVSTGHGTHPHSKEVVLAINGKKFGAGFLPYTGSWYIYDLETGEEQAAMREPFFKALEPFIIGKLVQDKNCKKAA